MNAEYVLFAVENADSFLKIHRNRLLKPLQDKTMADFYGCTKENISIGLKQHKSTMGKAIKVKGERQ
jgi:hypothetical protein